MAGVISEFREQGDRAALSLVLPPTLDEFRAQRDRRALELVFGPVPPKLIFDTEARELIWGPPDRPLTEEAMRSFQRWMAQLIMDKPGVYLGAEMGLGKTGACLLALVWLMEQGIITNPLIVAPLNVAENTWPDEIATWDFARHLTYRVVTGTEEERIAALRYPAQVTIINRENLVWLQEHLTSRHFRYDMLIYDEARRLAGGSKRTTPSKRADGTKAVHRNLSEFGILRKMRFRFKKIVELSGTPAPQGLTDLWGPIFLIDEGKRLLTSKTKFMQRWFNEDRYDYSIEPRHGAEEEIMDRIKDVFFSLREEDYLTLPPLMLDDRKAHLPPAAMEQYRRLERDMVLDEHAIEAVNSGVLTGKLLQLANGSLYLDSDNPAEPSAKGESVRIHDAKLDVLESIMSEANGAPVLVAYSFKFDVLAIKRRFPKVRIFGEGANDTKDWNAGRIGMMLTHPASAGHGMNFQHGGNIAVWYGLPWSLELYKQFIKRLHRQGQKADRVMLHRIIAAGTMDEKLVKVLGVKDATQDRITNAVRVHVEEVRRVDEMMRLAA